MNRASPPRPTLLAVLALTACGGGLQTSPEGSYASTQHAFEIRSDGTFTYEDLRRNAVLEGTWDATLETEGEVRNLGHIDIAVQSIRVSGESASQYDGGTGRPLYVVGQKNLGWWDHLGEEVHAIQERSFNVELELSGGPREPPGGGFVRWFGNPK